MTKPQAILLLGPTGSGKTPLGECLAARGLRGRPCRHFDFGEQLRQVAAAEPPPPGFSPEEADFLRGVLERGALLENRHFPLAEKILRAFLKGEMGTGSVAQRRCPSPFPPDDNGDRHVEPRGLSEPVPIIVLNGLPRHVDQARDVAGLLDVREVVVLHCPANVVLARIASNAGGDRTGRPDDAEVAVRDKLELFARRTAPLVAFYRAAGASVRTIEVARATTPEEILAALNAS